MMAEGDIVEDFFGVYLLFCTNPKYKGRTYIGYTVNPNRRLKQHNRGTKAGGAWKTSNKGPWEMVLLVHGFPNDIAALGFEWAWQHPHRSRRLRTVTRKKVREQKYDFCLRVLGNMLRARPWCRLPLTLRWIKPEYIRDFPPGLEPPVHIPIAFGPVKPVKVKKLADSKSDDDDIEEMQVCTLCKKVVEEVDKMRCLSPSCPLVAHMKCLAHEMLKDDIPNMLVPLEGCCPSCGIPVLWGDLVRLKRGCYQQKESESDDEDWVDSLSQVA